MEVTATAIRELLNRPTTPMPVTSVYLNTDGSRYPRPVDYETRLDNLLRDVRRAADGLDHDAAEAVRRDADQIGRWVRTSFERKGIRGLGLFASDGEIFEQLETAMGVRNIARVTERPYVVPLQALLGRHHHIALAVVERDQARIFRYQLCLIEEHIEMTSDVHGQHDQGGWSQARYQRSIEHEKLLHMKDVSDVLLKLHEQQPFDALIVAGPIAEATEFVRKMHPYLTKVLHGDPISLPLVADPDQFRAALRDVEQDLVSGRRRELLTRLEAGKGSSERVAWGVRHVVEAVNAKRVETLFVVEGSGERGWRSAPGALALHEHEAEAYGTPVTPVDDVIDEIIEQAVLSGSHIELFRDGSRLDGHTVAALLRF
ncbi:MAG TPA: Vms1/Ankzf1 family peptidyl-tRNA hydrolase [Euzebyales bacterium]|nr:Vms1/Ankzf1 family peptidyl-tRNA hydrolase [Euzebyales bacterium]